MTVTRVLVCGSNYGAAYFRALRERPDAYRVVGVLARGSLRSQRLAQRHGVPLYTDLDRIPPDVDLACAAMGHAAIDVVLGLLGAGIHVLLEHPVSPHDIERAAAEPARQRAALHINTLFPAFAAPRAFINGCRERPAPSVYVDVLATDRSLYATLDIVSQALGTLAPLSVAPVSSSAGLHSLHGTLAGVPAAIRVQQTAVNEVRRLPDGAAGYLVDCRVSAFFDDGSLTLLSVAGPVIWNAPFRRSAAPAEHTWRGVHTPLTSYGDLLAEQTRANIEAIDALNAQARGGPRPEVQGLHHQLDVSRGWEYIAQRLATVVRERSQ